MAISRKEQFENLKRLADQGDPKAQYEVGLYLKYGLYGENVNKLKALAYFKKAAEQNYIPAQVAFMDKRQVSKHLDFLKKAHNLGIHLASQYLINSRGVVVYDDGLDAELAKQYLNESMEKLLQEVESDDLLCSVIAQLHLAYYYECFYDLMGIRTKEEGDKKAFTFSLMASNTGCATAHFQVSDYYGNGELLNLSEKELIKREWYYFRLAVNQLEPEACYLVWFNYHDLEVGLKCLRRLSDIGYKEFSFLLAEFYAGDNDGQHKDASAKQRNFRKAVKYYLRAACAPSAAVGRNINYDDEDHMKKASEKLRCIQQDILSKSKSKKDIMDFIIAHYELGILLPSVLNDDPTVSKIKEEMEERGEQLKKEVNQIILHQYKLDVPKDILDWFYQYALVLKSNDGEIGLLPINQQTKNKSKQKNIL